MLDMIKLIKETTTLPLLECQSTGKQFKDVSNKSGVLTRHLSRLNVVFSKDTIPTFFRKVTLTNRAEFLPCPICDYKTKDTTNASGVFLRHVKSHGLTVDEFCKDHPDYKSIWQQHFLKKTRHDFISEDVANRIECKVCNQSFKKLTNLHLRKHNLTPSEYKLKFNVDNTCSVSTQSKQRNKSFFQQIDGVFERINACDVTPMFSREDYVGVEFENKYSFKCNKCKNVFEDHLDDGHDIICRVCDPKLKFHPNKRFEHEVFEFLQTLDLPDIIANDRTVIAPKEIDFYIESKNVGIELDGLYWHSEKFKSKRYHIKKTELMNQKGVRCIHIFEDEWTFKKEIVKNRLRHILGASTAPRIYARKCECKLISYEEKSDLLTNHHIQGNDISRHNVGAYYEGELVSVMTFAKPRIALGYSGNNSFMELSRFCTDPQYHVIGIAGKLLKFSIKNLNLDTIISYADLRYTDPSSSVYSKLGFNHISTTSPNYFWCKNNKRHHRFNFMKGKLIKDGFDPTKTETQIMHERGYYRIWDCGHLKYELTV
jgi:very-short-patch-repair endonuclease